jgi:hypothetical protein
MAVITHRNILCRWPAAALIAVALAGAGGDGSIIGEEPTVDTATDVFTPY